MKNAIYAAAVVLNAICLYIFMALQEDALWFQSSFYAQVRLHLQPSVAEYN